MSHDLSRRLVKLEAAKAPAWDAEAYAREIEAVDAWMDGEATAEDLAILAARPKPPRRVVLKPDQLRRILECP